MTKAYLEVLNEKDDMIREKEICTCKAKLVQLMRLNKVSGE